MNSMNHILIDAGMCVIKVRHRVFIFLWDIVENSTNIFLGSQCLPEEYLRGFSFKIFGEGCQTSNLPYFGIVVVVGLLEILLNDNCRC